MGQLRLGEVRLHPGGIGLHQHHGGHAHDTVLAGLGQLAGDAVGGGVDLGAGEIQPGLGELGGGLLIGGLLLHRQVDVAVQGGLYLLEPLLQRHLLLGCLYGELTGIVIVGGGGEVFGHQIRLAMLLLQGIGMAGACHDDLRLLAAITGLQRHQIGAHLGELRLGLGYRHLEGLGIQLEQRLTGLDLLVLIHIDLGHPAQHLGTDGHLVRLHIGVVGLDITATQHVDGTYAEQGQGRYNHQQKQTGPAAVRHRRLGRGRFGIHRNTPHSMLIKMRSILR